MNHSSNEPLLRVENLKMHFSNSKGFFNQTTSWLKAVDGVSFEVERGKTFGLVGESGCGKTTAGKCILRVLNPSGGHIYYNGRDIVGLRRRELKQIRRELQMIFQDPYSSLDPRQSVCSIVKEALTTDGRRHTPEELKTRVIELLEMVGLSKEMLTRYPHELSGGQRQRLGIARALACDPKLIVCDEPVSALDVSIQAQIINLFEKLQRELELTYIFVAHDLAVVRHIADRIGVMYLGHLVELMDSADLYCGTRHPYSQALLSAVPTTNYYEEKTRCRILLEGEVPSPVHAPSGCPFHPRCQFATQECKEEMPPLRDCGGGHMVACYHAHRVCEQ